MMIISLVMSCNNEQHNHPELNTGKDLYNYHCASCHKKNGSGMFLKGIPANITTNKNQTEIILHIKNGVQSKQSQMPVFSDMPDGEAYKIANHLLKLKSDYMNNPENRDKVLLERKK
ncbi:MAG: cytochrome c [gamma proteobacterium symbiont of Bathyaustriella thionipta]|nr:cytochrome c [gamma proteobacterium symbiont of Bathyaustriella thionipta]MCU7954353.1 cytochrome c [gamma proteobacterium symbiont of Bathyaustriella thionipta]